MLIPETEERGLTRLGPVCSDGRPSCQRIHFLPSLYCLLTLVNLFITLSISFYLLLASLKIN
jgi:hypothetical protein